MMIYDRANFDSDYLCPHCGGLLYVAGSMPPTDVCLNPVCPLWPSDLVSIIDVAEEAQPRLYHELQEGEQRLLAEIAGWKSGVLARYAYKARIELITMLFREGIMPSVDHFFAIGELLLLVNKQPSDGTIDDLERFRGLLESVRRWSQDQHNLEDVRTRRYVLGRTVSGIRGFSIKFAHAMNETQATMGIGSYNQISHMFQYMHLESAAITHVDPSHVTDASEILEPFWPISLQLRYLLRSHARTARQYDYRPDILDMTVLLGWCTHPQTWGRDGTSIIPAEKESKEIQELQAHFDKYAKRPFPAQDFVRNYVDSTELVPIVVRTPEGFVLDYLTLFFFIIYLQGCPNPELPAVAERGPLLVNMRAKVGEKFEEWVRSEIHQHGYDGPNQPVIEHYEYDIMAISEDKRRIIIADAKYRDMAPSSLTGTNLVQQELLDPHGLRNEASRQQERLDYFRQNLPKFSQYLNPERPWEEYEICSYLITKHFPLARRYKETRIIRAIEFLAVEV
ncbi:MAG: hypothetical protein Q7K03_01345 [Dehalococcoidia bacterium]|nr:hypothetical protein [Dehalococcoidia bacterium]